MDKKYKKSAIYLMDVIGKTNKNISDKVQKIMDEEKNKFLFLCKKMNMQKLTLILIILTTKKMNLTI